MGDGIRGFIRYSQPVQVVPRRIVRVSLKLWKGGSSYEG